MLLLSGLGNITISLLCCYEEAFGFDCIVGKLTDFLLYSLVMLPYFFRALHYRIWHSDYLRREAAWILTTKCKLHTTVTFILLHYFILLVFLFPGLFHSSFACHQELEVFYLFGLLLIFTMLITCLISKVPLKFDAFGIVTEFKQCLRCWAFFSGVELALKAFLHFFDTRALAYTMLAPVPTLIQLIMHLSTFYISLVKPLLTLTKRNAAEYRYLPLSLCLKSNQHKVIVGMQRNAYNQETRDIQPGPIFGYCSFEELFSNEAANKKLKDLATSHYVVEMTEFLSNVYLYREMSPDNLIEMHKQYLFILEEFIEEGSPYQVNIHHQMRADVCSAATPMQFVKLTTRGRQMIFDKCAGEVQKLVMQNLVQPHGSSIDWKAEIDNNRQSLFRKLNRAPTSPLHKLHRAASGQLHQLREYSSDVTPPVQKFNFSAGTMVRKAIPQTFIRNRNGQKKQKIAAPKSLFSCGISGPEDLPKSPPQHPRSRGVSSLRSRGSLKQSSRLSSLKSRSSVQYTYESRSRYSKEDKKTPSTSRKDDKATPPSFRCSLATLSRGLSCNEASEVSQECTFLSNFEEVSRDDRKKSIAPTANAPIESFFYNGLSQDAEETKNQPTPNSLKHSPEHIKQQHCARTMVSEEKLELSKEMLQSAARQSPVATKTTATQSDRLHTSRGSVEHSYFSGKEISGGSNSVSVFSRKTSRARRGVVNKASLVGHIFLNSKLHGSSSSSSMDLLGSRKQTLDKIALAERLTAFASNQDTPEPREPKAQVHPFISVPRRMRLQRAWSAQGFGQPKQQSSPEVPFAQNSMPTFKSFHEAEKSHKSPSLAYQIGNHSSSDVSSSSNVLPYTKGSDCGEQFSDFKQTQPVSGGNFQKRTAARPPNKSFSESPLLKRNSSQLDLNFAAEHFDLSARSHSLSIKRIDS